MIRVRHLFITVEISVVDVELDEADVEVGVETDV
jgi:hypothetical protein